MGSPVEAEAPKWRDMRDAPKDGTEIIARVMWRGEYGYTEDREGWTGIRWDWRTKNWVETKTTGRYYNEFIPYGWFPVPQG